MSADQGINLQAGFLPSESGFGVHYMTWAAYA